MIKSSSTAIAKKLPSSEKYLPSSIPGLNFRTTVRILINKL